MQYPGGCNRKAVLDADYRQRVGERDRMCGREVVERCVRADFAAEGVVDERR